MDRYRNLIIIRNYFHFTGEDEQELLRELVKIRKTTKTCSAFHKVHPPIGQINVNSRYFSKSWISKHNFFYGWIVKVI